MFYNHCSFHCHASKDLTSTIWPRIIFLRVLALVEKKLLHVLTANFWLPFVEFLPPANEVCEGYVFTGVCLSTGGMRAWLLTGGCMVAPGGHAWLLRGACMVSPRGGMRGCSGGGHAWLLPGGGGCAWDMTRYRDTVNERAVCILLEFILVNITFKTVKIYQAKNCLKDFALNSRAVSNKNIGRHTVLLSLWNVTLIDLISYLDFRTKYKMPIPTSFSFIFLRQVYCGRMNLKKNQ